MRVTNYRARRCLCSVLAALNRFNYQRGEHRALGTPHNARAAPRAIVRPQYAITHTDNRGKPLKTN